MARPLIDQEYLRTDQYRDAAKLDARVQLHVRFSANQYGWFQWVFHITKDTGIFEAVRHRTTRAEEK